MRLTSHSFCLRLGALAACVALALVLTALRAKRSQACTAEDIQSAMRAGATAEQLCRLCGGKFCNNGPPGAIGPFATNRRAVEVRDELRKVGRRCGITSRNIFDSPEYYVVC